jgi:signal transduction histidine kinase
VRRLQPFLVLPGLVLFGAAGALVVAKALGMRSSELARLGVLLLPASAGTVVVAVAASRILERTSLSRRFLAIAAVGTVVALANLLVLTRAMFVSAHAATVLVVVLTYATAAGLATAFSSASASASAIDRVTGTAELIGRGDLSARVGPLGAGSDLDRLAATLDQTAVALQRARDQEQRVERTRRDLITAVSHDLRTPLANLQAMAEAIDDGVVDDAATFRRYAREMRRSVGQLSSLVDDLFEFVQADAIDIGQGPDLARLDEVTDSALDAIRPEVDRKRLVLAADVRGAGDVTCSPHLGRVLQNLLANAVRHTPAGGNVTVEARLVDGALVVAVNDSGTGIAEQDLPHVFEPFYRGDPARAGGGAGLGLALADRLVRAMGGSISATSPGTGGGARFDVRIPIDGAVRTSGGASGSARTRSGGRRGSGSRRPS